MRLFIAIDLPDTVKRELTRVAESLGRQAERARVVPEENFHITLVFIGETRRVNEVKKLAREVCTTYCAEPFNLIVNGLASFGQRPKRPERGHTWWASVDAPPELHQLVAALSATLRHEGFVIERRSYQPHITLARGVLTSKPIELAIPALEVRVSHISLMRSTRVDNHMVYTEIAQM
jgi:2'-5' RNA ligase